MGSRENECLLLVIIILAALVLGYTLVPVLAGASAFTYYYKPLFWFAMAVYVLRQPKVRFRGKLKLYRFIILWSVICGILYLSVFFLGGFVDGIGRSPYSKSTGGIIANILSLGSVLVFMEVVRSYIINRVRREYTFLFVVLTVIVFTVFRLNLRMALTIETLQQAVQYIGEYVLPEIMNNIFLAYLVYIGGAYPAILYVTLTNFPIWLIPLLPNLTWITKAFIGIFMPVTFIMVIQRVYKKQTREIKIREQKRENPVVWLGACAVSVILIWFSVGVLPVFPTVILTGSMQPVLNPGDVALMQKVSEDKINVGDIIQFWTGEAFIIHRVIYKNEENGRFQTKGDNNITPDSAPVYGSQIKGKMIGIIPKIGILAKEIRSIL